MQPILSKRILGPITTVASWLLLLATLAAWAASQHRPWSLAFGTNSTRGHVAFQTQAASFEFIHDPAGGAERLLRPYNSGTYGSGPLDLLKDFHGPARIINLLGPHLHLGHLPLPPGRFSPFRETHHFSIAALTIPNPHLLTLASLQCAFFTWRLLRSRRRNRAPGFPLAPAQPTALSVDQNSRKGQQTRRAGNEHRAFRLPRSMPGFRPPMLSITDAFRMIVRQEVRDHVDRG